jgi:hypothetical protein
MVVADMSQWLMKRRGRCLMEVCSPPAAAMGSRFYSVVAVRGGESGDGAAGGGGMNRQFDPRLWLFGN